MAPDVTPSTETWTHFGRLADDRRFWWETREYV